MTSSSTELVSFDSLLPLVDVVVARMRALPIFDDLRQVGRICLFESMGELSQLDLGEARSYAYVKIRGAVLDEFRRQDPLSRYARTRLRMVHRVAGELEVVLGRSPTDPELAGVCSLSLTALRALQDLAAAAVVLSLDAETGSFMVPDAAALAPEVLEEVELVDGLNAALDALPRPQARVLRLYYFEGLTLRQIAKRVGCSVVRIHQIRAQAEAALREDPMLVLLRTA